ncbi:MAG: hypothetical protein V4733_06435 [Verrucomicrobiota bacterium]
MNAPALAIADGSQYSPEVGGNIREPVPAIKIVNATITTKANF